MPNIKFKKIEMNEIPDIEKVKIDYDKVKEAEEKKNKISKAQKGREFTEEHKQKLSEAAKNRHVPCSEEKKKKLSQNYPNKKKVYCEELDRIFDSVQQCSKELEIPATNISKLCGGKGKTLKGYHLRYYNDTINA